MKRLIVSLGALLFAGIVCAQPYPECNPNEIMTTCFKPFSNLHFDVVHGFTVNDMRTMCADWTLAKPCLHKFTGGICRGYLPDSLIRSMRALEKVAEYVCKDALKEITMEHECFFSSHTAAAKCQVHLGAGVARATNPAQLFAVLQTAGGCNLLSKYENCVVTAMRTTCSVQASNVIRHVYELINNEVQVVLGCTTPILTTTSPVQIPPELPVEDIPPPRLPKNPLRGDKMLMCMMRLGNMGFGKSSADRCSMITEVDACVRRAARECKNGYARLPEHLKAVERIAKDYGCEVDNAAATKGHHSQTNHAFKKERHHHLDRGTKIAIGAGVAAVVLVLATLLVAVCHVRRRRVQKTDKAHLIEKETYNSNLAVAIEEANKEEKKPLP